MQTLTIATTDTYVAMECGKCGCKFALLHSFYKEQKEELGAKGGWYCPNGHPRVFRESDVAKLERQLAQERQKRDQAEASARQANLKLTKTESSMRRLKDRMAKGLCPCCHQAFADLQGHMESKHPGFGKPVVRKAKK